MVLLIHVLIALSSVAFSAFTFFAPSRLKLNISYGLVALTLGSGTYLVLSTHSPMLQSCFSGITYVMIILFGLIPARLKLARANSISDK